MAKILLVEDNEMNRDMLSRRLRKKGYEVVIAVDGAQALVMARSEAPDLILMDMALPVLDGWDATRQLKSMPDTKAIGIIALSAHALVDDKDKALEAGCDDFDTKPVDFKRLLGKIEALLTRRIAPCPPSVRSSRFFATNCARRSITSSAMEKCCSKTLRAVTVATSNHPCGVS